ncbi:unnamed protein product, partial [Nesidiocoris tenuis]
MNPVGGWDANRFHSEAGAPDWSEVRRTSPAYLVKACQLMSMISLLDSGAGPQFEFHKLLMLIRDIRPPVIKGIRAPVTSATPSTNEQ